jgi:hypothetical protein
MYIKKYKLTVGEAVLREENIRRKAAVVLGKALTHPKFANACLLNSAVIIKIFLVNI